MQHAGVQYGQGASNSHHPTPQFTPPDDPSNSNTATSLRAWRKKDVPEKTLGDQSPMSESQATIARIAPHTHYSRPPEIYRYPQYGEYGLQFKDTAPTPVKYSEIVDNPPIQRIEHIPQPIPKVTKEKEYIDMCSLQQSHLKTYPDHVNYKSYNEPPLKQYGGPPMQSFIPKEPQMHPYITKEPHPHPFMQKEPQFAPYLQKINMQSQYPRNYNEPNNILAHLNKIDPQMAQAIMNDPHLREPTYIEQNHLYQQTSRVYRPMQTSPTFNSRNISQNFNSPPGYNFNIKHMPPMSHRDTYQMQHYQHNIPKYSHDILQRRSFPENVQYVSMSTKLSPSYNQCNQLEYAHHYRHRRPQIPMEYYEPQNKSPYAIANVPVQNSSAATTKSNALKQFLETWNEEELTGNVIEMTPSRVEVEKIPVIKGSIHFKDGPNEQQFYVLDSQEISSENITQYLHLQQVEKISEKTDEAAGEGFNTQPVIQENSNSETATVNTNNTSANTNHSFSIENEDQNIFVCHDSNSPKCTPNSKQMESNLNLKANVSESLINNDLLSTKQEHTNVTPTNEHDTMEHNSAFKTFTDKAINFDKVVGEISRAQSVPESSNLEINREARSKSVHEMNINFNSLETCSPAKDNNTLEVPTEKIVYPSVPSLTDLEYPQPLDECNKTDNKVIDNVSFERASVISENIENDKFNTAQSQNIQLEFEEKNKIALEIENENNCLLEEFESCMLSTTREKVDDSTTEQSGNVEDTAMLESNHSALDDDIETITNRALLSFEQHGNIEHENIKQSGDTNNEIQYDQNAENQNEKALIVVESIPKICEKETETVLNLTNKTHFQNSTSPNCFEEKVPEQTTVIKFSTNVHENNIFSCNNCQTQANKTLEESTVHKNNVKVTDNLGNNVQVIHETCEIKIRDDNKQNIDDKNIAKTEITSQDNIEKDENESKVQEIASNLDNYENVNPIVIKEINNENNTNENNTSESKTVSVTEEKLPNSNEKSEYIEGKPATKDSDSENNLLNEVREVEKNVHLDLENDTELIIKYNDEGDLKDITQIKTQKNILLDKISQTNDDEKSCDSDEKQCCIINNNVPSISIKLNLKQYKEKKLKKANKKSRGSLKFKIYKNKYSNDFSFAPKEDLEENENIDKIDESDVDEVNSNAISENILQNDYCQVVNAINHEDISKTFEIENVEKIDNRKENKQLHFTNDSIPDLKQHSILTERNLDLNATSKKTKEPDANKINNFNIYDITNSNNTEEAMPINIDSDIDKTKVVDSMEVININASELENTFHSGENDGLKNKTEETHEEIVEEKDNNTNKETINIILNKLTDKLDSESVYIAEQCESSMIKCDNNKLENSQGQLDVVKLNITKVRRNSKWKKIIKKKLLKLNYFKTDVARKISKKYRKLHKLKIYVKKKKIKTIHPQINVEPTDENVEYRNLLNVNDNNILLDIGGEIIEVAVIFKDNKKLVSVTPLTNIPVVINQHQASSVEDVAAMDLEENETLKLSEKIIDLPPLFESSDLPESITNDKMDRSVNMNDEHITLHELQNEKLCNFETNSQEICNDTKISYDLDSTIDNTNLNMNEIFVDSNLEIQNEEIINSVDDEVSNEICSPTIDSTEHIQHICPKMENGIKELENTICQNTSNELCRNVNEISNQRETNISKTEHHKKKPNERRILRNKGCKKFKESKQDVHFIHKEVKIILEKLPNYENYPVQIKNGKITTGSEIKKDEVASNKCNEIKKRKVKSLADKKPKISQNENKIDKLILIKQKDQYLKKVCKSNITETKPVEKQKPSENKSKEAVKTKAISTIEKKEINIRKANNNVLNASNKLIIKNNLQITKTSDELSKQNSANCSVVKRIQQTDVKEYPKRNSTHKINYEVKRYKDNPTKNKIIARAIFSKNLKDPRLSKHEEPNLSILKKKTNNDCTVESKEHKVVRFNLSKINDDDGTNTTIAKECTTIKTPAQKKIYNFGKGDFNESVVENSNKRRLSLEEYNSRKRKYSLTEPDSTSTEVVETIQKTQNIADGEMSLQNHEPLDLVIAHLEKNINQNHSPSIFTNEQKMDNTNLKYKHEGYFTRNYSFESNLLNTKEILKNYNIVQEHEIQSTTNEDVACATFSSVQSCNEEQKVEIQINKDEHEIEENVERNECIHKTTNITENDKENKDVGQKAAQEIKPCNSEKNLNENVIMDIIEENTKSEQENLFKYNNVETIDGSDDNISSKSKEKEFDSEQVDLDIVDKKVIDNTGKNLEQVNMNVNENQTKEHESQNIDNKIVNILNNNNKEEVCDVKVIEKYEERYDLTNDLLQVDLLKKNIQKRRDSGTQSPSTNNMSECSTSIQSDSERIRELLDSIKLDLPKFNVSRRQNMNEEKNKTHIPSPLIEKKILESKILIRKLSNKEALTPEELIKVHQIIKYKRVVEEQKKSFRNEYKPGTSEMKTSSYLDFCDIKSRKEAIREEKISNENCYSKKKNRFKNLYTDSDSDSDDYACSSNNNYLTERYARSIDNLNKHSAEDLRDYAVYQSNNNEGVPKIIIKRRLSETDDDCSMEKFFAKRQR